MSLLNKFRALLLICGAVIAASVVAFFAFRPGAGSCLHCNVVLISIDSLRVDHLSAYGYHRTTSPNIDKLAAKSIRFQNYFSSAYLTPISEASVHTGFYPPVNGMIGFRRQISPDVKTMAEILHENGYRTAAIGTSPEFETFEDIKTSFSRGFDRYDITAKRFDHFREPYWPEVRRFLSERGRTPFFLWMPLGVVHAPYGFKTPNRFADAAYHGPFQSLKWFTNMQFYFDGLIYNIFEPGKDFSIISWPTDIGGAHKAPADLLKGRTWPARATAEDMKFITDMYDNGVAAADDQVGFLLQVLKELNLDKDTVVILQSEHGESLGEHGYIAHYDIWDETTHVPLLISSPKLRPQVFAGLVSGIDVLPSLLTHLGFDPGPFAFDGQTFLSKAGRLGSGRDKVFITRTPLWESLLKTLGSKSIFDRFRQLDDQIGFKDFAVRTRDSKLIHRTARLAEERFSCWTYISGKKIHRNEFEYYDLRSDPGELKPLGLETAGAKELEPGLRKFETSMNVRYKLTPNGQKLQDYQ